MEIKKSPKADLENKRSMFVLIGLVLAFGFTYICFEWTDTEVTVDETFITPDAEEGPEEIVQSTTQMEEIVQPEPEVQQQERQQIKIVDDTVVTTGGPKINSEDTTNLNNLPTVNLGNTEEVVDDDQTIFIVVEKKAGYPGGDKELMKFLKDNLSYPSLAIEKGISGRVFVEFVVNRDGSIQDIKVSRSVSKELDEEAIRVIKMMPKWTPAQQQGKSVRSRFTLPVLFRLK